MTASEASVPSQKASNRTSLPELLGFEAGVAHAVAFLRAWAAKLEASPACHEDVIQAAALSAAAGAIERGEPAPARSSPPRGG